MNIQFVPAQRGSILSLVEVVESIHLAADKHGLFLNPSKEVGMWNDEDMATHPGLKQDDAVRNGQRTDELKRGTNGGWNGANPQVLFDP